MTNQISQIIVVGFVIFIVLLITWAHHMPYKRLVLKSHIGVGPNHPDAELLVKKKLEDYDNRILYYNNSKLEQLKKLRLEEIAWAFGLHPDQG